MPWAEKLLLVRAFVQICRAWLLVRVLPYSRLKATLASLNSREIAQRNVFDVQPIKWSVEAVSRRCVGSNCLIQAIAGTRLLRDSGYDARLKLGVAKPNLQFDAHAWVELEGRVVLGGGNSPDHFTILAVPERRDVR